MCSSDLRPRIFLLHGQGRPAMNAHTVASSSRVASSLAGTAEPVAPRQLYRFAHVTRPDKLATVLAADGLRLGELVPQQTLFRAVDAASAAAVAVAATAAAEAAMGKTGVAAAATVADVGTVGLRRRWRPRPWKRRRGGEVWRRWRRSPKKGRLGGGSGDGGAAAAVVATANEAPTGELAGQERSCGRAMMWCGSSLLHPFRSGTVGGVSGAPAPRSCGGVEAVRHRFCFLTACRRCR